MEKGIADYIETTLPFCINNDAVDEHNT